MNAESIFHPPTRNKLLTIYIMAYENAACVAQLLDSLLPLNGDDIAVLVGDNSDSTRDVAHTVSRYKNVIPNLDRVHFNANIAAGSAIRAFEIVESKYLWIVGACNRFRPNAVGTLRQILTEDEPDVLMHYENDLHRHRETREPRRYTDFLEAMSDHSFSVLGSINSLVYRTELMRPFVRYGYESLSMMMPHAGMLYAAMRAQAVTVSYYPIEIFERLPRERKWSMARLIECLHAVLPEGADPRERREFYRRLMVTDPYFNELARSEKLRSELVFPWKMRSYNPIRLARRIARWTMEISAADSDEIRK